MYELIIGYIIIIGLFIFINAFIAGFNGLSLTFKDFLSCLIWPISLITLLGVLTKIIYQKIKTKDKTDDTQFKYSK